MELVWSVCNYFFDTNWWDWFYDLMYLYFNFSKKKIGIISRSIMQNSISSPQVGGIVKITKFIIWGTFIIEAIGAFYYH
ncbi:hypothetical protein SD457_02225 [Coprobacillaceae bacterium CR2/5/TPMF4]|nr:hypothetical protein SD457_02225 [Coprobacillaceae bacterium CR2/5/TPMF4]